MLVVVERIAPDRRLAKRKAKRCVLYELLVAFQVISAGPHPPVYRVFQGGHPAAPSVRSISAAREGSRRMEDRGETYYDVHCEWPTYQHHSGRMDNGKIS